MRKAVVPALLCGALLSCGDSNWVDFQVSVAFTRFEVRVYDGAIDPAGLALSGRLQLTNRQHVAVTLTLQRATLLHLDRDVPLSAGAAMTLQPGETRIFLFSGTGENDLMMCPEVGRGAVDLYLALADGEGGQLRVPLHFVPYTCVEGPLPAR